MVRLGVVLDGMIAIRVGAPAVETGQTHVQTALTVLLIQTQVGDVRESVQEG